MPKPCFLDILIFLKFEYSASGKLLFNPGSLGEPRLQGKATYGILTVTPEGLFPHIFTLDTTN